MSLRVAQSRLAQRRVVLDGLGGWAARMDGDRLAGEGCRRSGLTRNAPGPNVRRRHLAPSGGYHRPPPPDSMSRSPQHLPEPDERTRRTLATELDVRRALRRVFARAVLLCVVWLVLGLALIGWAVHTNDHENGIIAFWAGLLIANGGIVITLLVSYHRAMSEGWP